MPRGPGRLRGGGTGGGGLREVGGYRAISGAHLHAITVDLVRGGRAEGSQIRALLIHDTLRRGACLLGAHGRPELDRALAVGSVRSRVVVTAARAPNVADLIELRGQVGAGHDANHGLLAVVVSYDGPTGARQVGALGVEHR